VQGADDTQLLCDSDDLHASLSNHAGPLAKLMAAYLRSGPGADPLAIEWRDGRYRLSAP
jgi:hypothetical protein